MNRVDGNAFKRFWDLGYHSLLPVMPIDPDIRNSGKRPGVKIKGRWSGRAANSFSATPELLDIWQEMGAGVGLSCFASGFCGVDIDCLNEALVERIAAIAFEMLGKTAVRVGQRPKVMLVYRCDPATSYRRIAFDDERDSPAKPALVELQAGDAKWFVVHGIHPATGRLYSWPHGVWPAEELPLATGDQLQALFARLEAELPAARGSEATAVDRSSIDQDSLKGDLDLIEAAMAVIPNDVVDYDNVFVRMAAALRGACQEDFNLGLDLFVAWSEKVAVEAPTEDAERVYRSIVPPFKLGADYIYEAAKKAGWAGAWYVAPPAGVGSEGAEKAVEIRATPYAFPDPATIPPRDFLYAKHYIRRFLSTTIGPTGLGKSSLIISEALAMASGKPLLGVKPKGVSRVWLWNGEDPVEEMERRIEAVLLEHRLTRADFGDRLWLDTGRGLPLVLARQLRDGARIVEPIACALLQEIRRLRLDVVVIDPFVSSHRVTENDNSAIEVVVERWMRIAEAGNCSIELVHHARKLNNEEITVDAARGAVALVAKARSVRTLARMTKDEAKLLGLSERRASLFRFADSKANMSFVSDTTRWLQLKGVPLGNGPGTGAERFAGGDEVAVVLPFLESSSINDFEQAQKEAVLDLVDRGVYRRDMRAGDAWIGVPVGLALKLDRDDKGDRERIKRIIHDWLADGTLAERLVKDKHRKEHVHVVRGSRGVFD